MTDIRQTQLQLMDDAKKLGDYQSLTKTELANGYCDADEAEVTAQATGNTFEARRQSELKDHYFSALMLRYWYKIFDWARNSASLQLELSDFVDWLTDSLYVAFYYRMWRYENEAVVRHGVFESWKLDAEGNKIPNKYYYKTDDSAVDKIINRCCASMRGRVYQYYNKDKRKADIQTYSLESMVEDNGDSALVFSNCASEGNVVDNIFYLVNKLLNKGEHLEALIVDGIANYETYKTSKKTIYNTEVNEETGEETKVKNVEVESQFDPRKLVKHLNLINQYFMQQFCKNYSITEAIGDSIYTELKNTTNVKLYKRIKKTLLELRETPELLECLYN